MPRIRTAPLERSQRLTSSPNRVQSQLGAYLTLVKPRIIEQLLVTTIPTMFVAARGVPGVWLMVATLLGGTLAAAGANAINMVIDRDIDALMDRTKHRPLVTGAITPRNALTFAIGLEMLAFGWLWWQVNLLSAVLAVAACLFYVFVYTLWLKRVSVENIVIGGAAGAVPVLIGWSAVRNSLSLAPIVLFAVIFVWTPPHFWALAVKYKDDYGKAGVPMLPVVASLTATARRIIAYTVVLWALSIVFYSVGGMGLIYLGTAIVAGAAFLAYAIALYREGTVKQAMRLFVFSNAYITLLFGAMALDQVIKIGH
jgi:heme o synthase